MSSKIWIVLIVFLSWSFVSWNWYTCDIKGYCALDENSIEITIPDEYDILPSQTMSVAEIIATAEDEEHTILEPIEIVPKVIKEHSEELRSLMPFHFTFMYNSDQSRFRQKTTQEIEHFCKELNDSRLQVDLIGHTDDAWEADNVLLGLQRANTVKDHLITCGCHEARMNVLSRGSDEAIYGNKTVNQRAKNRRVEITLSDE